MSHENIKKRCHKKSNCVLITKVKKTFKSSSLCSTSNFHNDFIWNPSKVQRSLWTNYPLSLNGYFQRNITKLPAMDCFFMYKGWQYHIYFSGNFQNFWGKVFQRALFSVKDGKIAIGLAVEKASFISSINKIFIKK